MSTTSQQSPKPIKLIYNVIDRSAKKIATLVKIAKLNYEIQEIHDEAGVPHVLYTPSGELYKEYEIINYIITQSRDLKKTKTRENKDNNENKGEKQTSLTNLAEPEAVQEVSRQADTNKTQQVLSLQADDPYITAKMHQKLFQLRVSLFPLLQEFYKYLTGFEKTKKSKYDSLMNKIKKEIGKLDADITEHPQIFHSENNFLNIIIACEILMACKFVFEEKFRKYKYSLFNKYQKISHRKEFIQVHGKSDLCQKQYVPSEFEEDQQTENHKKQSEIPSDIIKISNSILGAQPDSNRNQLLYNYFKTTFNQSQSKKQYFPYFWLMFEDLNCSLIQVVQNIEQNSQINGSLKLKVLHKKIMDELNPQIDYGMLGLYQSQKDKKFIIRGLICLGSKSTQDFQASFQKPDSIQVKLHKVDTTNEKQKKQVQNLWEHVTQNTVQDDINLNVIMHF